METKEKKLDELIADTKSYIDSRLEHLHLKSVEKGAKLFSDLVTSTVVFVFFLLAFLLATITLAFFLSNLFGSYVAGFGSVAALYFILSVAVVLAKKRIIETYLVNTFIKKYFEKIADKDETE
jgi:hypothetical protein